MHSSEILYPVALANPYRILAIEISFPLHSPGETRARALENQLATRLRERGARSPTIDCKQASNHHVVVVVLFKTPINVSKTLYIGLHYQPVQHSTDRT